MKRLPAISIPAFAAAIIILGMYVLVFVAPARTQTSVTSPANFTPLDFSAVNIGTKAGATGGIAHLTVKKATAFPLGNPDIVFIPHSRMATLSRDEKSQLRKQVDAGHFVILWNDGSSPVSLSELENGLGYGFNKPGKEPGAPALVETPYAVGLVKLPGGEIDQLSFAGKGITELNKLGLESIWGGLAALRSTPPFNGPNAGGAGPSYCATTTYTFGTDGEVSTTDGLTMVRVNNDKLSVWADQLDYAVIPGSVLYSSGQTQFQQYVETAGLAISDFDAPGEQVTNTQPNSCQKDQTLAMGLSCGGMGKSWSWPTQGVDIYNRSTTCAASWNLRFEYYTRACRSAYIAEPGWQMTNAAGDFVFTREITPTWYNRLSGYAGYNWTDAMQSTVVTESDW